MEENQGSGESHLPSAIQAKTISLIHLLLQRQQQHACQSGLLRGFAAQLGQSDLPRQCHRVRLQL